MFNWFKKEEKQLTYECEIYLDKDATLPVRKLEGDVGYDLSANEDTTIPANQTKLVHTGVWAQGLPKGIEIQVRPRSGLSLKSNVMAVFGTVDSSYFGEICVIVHNFNNEPFVIKKGDRIAQAVFNAVWLPTIKSVSVKKCEGERGAKGFGSTGV